MTKTITGRLAESRSLVLGLLLAALMAVSLMLAASLAHDAADFTVTNSGDPGNGQCNAAWSGPLKRA